MRLAPSTESLPAPSQALTDLASALTQLECGLYVSIAGLTERAEALAERARGLTHGFSLARADLIRSDALSREGKLESALERQRQILAQARTDRDAAVEARASCYLASTYSRLGMLPEMQEAAGDGVARLDTSCSPPHWPFEHLMVLALFTGLDRSTADFSLFEDALRGAREFAEPTMVLVVLNNFAWTAATSPKGRERSVELADEMTRLIVDQGVAAAPAVLDTVAWIRLCQGDTDAAERLLERGLSAGEDVEPHGMPALLTHLASVRRRQGRAAEATRLLERARALSIATGIPESAAEALPALAELDAERGEYRRAYRRLRRYLEERGRFERAESERRAAVLESIHATRVERDQRRYYQELASRDPLTGLYNRRQLEQELPELLSQSVVALAMIDIDHFKQINDAYSHDVGDAVLIQLAAMLRDHASRMTPAGFAVRLGGEEFVIVAPRAGPQTARREFERLRLGIAGATWPGLPADLRPTVSIGLAIGDADSATRRSLLALADDRLYAAKRDGRNRLVDDGGGERPQATRRAPGLRVA